MDVQPVQLSFALSRWGDADSDSARLILMVKVSARRDPDFRRPPLNVSFVIDRSSSMRGEPLHQVKHAAKYAASQLTEQDQASIIAFDENAQQLVRHEAVRKQCLLDAFEDITAGKWTNLSSGWLMGVEAVAGAVSPGTLNRVLLLTDGCANVGTKDRRTLVNWASGFVERRVVTTTIGFGSHFDEDLLKAMAEAGGGNFHFCETAEDAPTIFAREFHELLRLAVQNVRLRVTPADGVQLIGALQSFSSRTHDRQLELSLGDLCGGEARNVLLEFFLPARSSGPLAELEVSYHQVGEDVVLKSAQTRVSVPHDDKEFAVDPIVWREVLLAQAALQMEHARLEADAGHLTAARERLQSTATTITTSTFGRDPVFQQVNIRLQRLQTLLETQADYHSRGRKALIDSSATIQINSNRLSSRLTMHQQRLLRAQRVVFVVSDQVGRADATPNVFNLPKGIDPWAWIRRCQTAALSRIPPEWPLLAAFARRWMATFMITTAPDLPPGILHPMRVVELNGSIFRGRCPDDGRVYSILEPDRAQPIGECGHVLTPDLPASGEMHIRRQAESVLLQADAIVVLGSPDSVLIPILQNAFVLDRLVVTIINGPRPSWSHEHLQMLPLQGLHTLATETSTILP